MSRKSLVNRVQGSRFSLTSSPLRKSIAQKNIAPQILIDNDDEAERLLLRRESLVNNTVTSNASSDKRHSLGLSSLSNISEPHMKEHISHCIKLNTENKINVKNAFCLEMIDFMTFMVTKKKSNNIDLRQASTSLDVMTQIYSYRVDGLYKEVLNIAGSLDKQKKDDVGASDEQEVEVHQSLKKDQFRTKKKNKQKILSTNDALVGSIETSYSSQLSIGSGDLYKTDMLHQAILPNHANSGFYYHPYNDVILDVLDNPTEHDKNLLKYTIPPIEDCSNLDICSTFANLKVLNWSSENESIDLKVTEENNESRFRFDLDAESPIDEYEPEHINCYEEYEDESNTNQCRRNTSQVENIVDLCSILVAQKPLLDKPLEYSFIEKHTHWAGPYYWKIRTFGKSLSNSKTTEICHQKILKNKPDIVLYYNDNAKSEAKKKESPGQAIKIQMKTAHISWKANKITLPEDIHYDSSQLSKLYLHPLRDINYYVDKSQLSSIQFSENENGNYNNENDHYNNENDNCDSKNDIAEYCPITDTQRHEIQESSNLDELRPQSLNSVECQIAFTQNNLVDAPKLTQKTFLQYSLCAKKIDMRQLKQTIWKSLTSSDADERMDIENEIQIGNRREVKEPKSLSIIYKSLPNGLSKTNAEALSLPIAFVSLLHLSNEKSLKLTSLPDLSDIIVEAD